MLKWRLKLNGISFALGWWGLGSGSNEKGRSHRYTDTVFRARPAQAWGLACQRAGLPVYERIGALI